MCVLCLRAKLCCGLVGKLLRDECRRTGPGVRMCECDATVCVLWWHCLVLCSLRSNSLEPEGATAISRGLVSVPQLQTLKYVFDCSMCVCCVCVRAHE